MNIALFGGAGFIGKNLTLKLAEDANNHITVVDADRAYFSEVEPLVGENVAFRQSSFDRNTDFASLLEGQEIVYHLVSSSVPTTANSKIPQEMDANIVTSALFLDGCVKAGVKRVVFLSSGGTVYGKEGKCPLKEDTLTKPITSYGVQKLAIEQLLYLYWYMHGLDYRIIRPGNPYGPYQRPNGVLGAATTFTYKALKKEEITVYGDGSVVRDYIYIDDAVRAIIDIANGEGEERLFNLGCGYGTSLNELLSVIKKVVGEDLNITYRAGRSVDVPVNYLDIERYETAFGKLNPISLEEGIRRTADFLAKHYV
ncbi:MAG: NAD-dependent epimerase/dehydratase family protein [Clostridia bacterium]|nr:NAD-dependent epimerase/dehydratase family protein [Clostridia bacterium]